MRRFKKLSSVWAAYDELDPKWLPFAEVRCARPHPNGGVYWPRIDRQGHVQP